MWPIFRLQKIALRIIFNIRKRSSTAEACRKANILRLPDIHSLNIGIFMYKYTSRSLPPIFNDFFLENRAIHNYPTRNASKMRIPRVRTTLAERFIRKTGVKFWNEISEHLDINCSIHTYKKRLKLHLTRNYSDNIWSLLYDTCLLIYVKSM
jgi:hypothetical protein